MASVQSLALADLRGVLTEFLGSIGSEGSASEAERERQRVKRMLAALGQEPTEDGAAPAMPAPASGSEPGEPVLELNDSGSFTVERALRSRNPASSSARDKLQKSQPRLWRSRQDLGGESGREVLLKTRRCSQ